MLGGTIPSSCCIDRLNPHHAEAARGGAGQQLLQPGLALLDGLHADVPAAIDQQDEGAKRNQVGAGVPASSQRPDMQPVKVGAKRPPAY